MARANKVVLAYSGGVDTSVCIPYLKNEWGVAEVITFAADLGQGDELEPIRLKALASGASEAIVGDLITPFINEFAFPAIRATITPPIRPGRTTTSAPRPATRGRAGMRTISRRAYCMPEHCPADAVRCYGCDRTVRRPPRPRPTRRIRREPARPARNREGRSTSPS